MARTLWLIGMMGSGKTTIAPLVAAILEREWVDADEAVEHLAGRRIADLFAESEASFREVEAVVVDDVAGTDSVVACGGGVVTQPALVDLMRSTGTVIWLRAGLEALVGRVGDGVGRPLLQGDPTRALEQILEARAAMYGAAADAAVDTDDRTPADVAAEVVRAWNASSEE